MVPSERVSSTRQWRGSIVGGVLAAVLRRVSRTAELSVTSDDPEIAADRSGGSVAEALLRDAARGHVIMPFWSAHQLTIALLASERFGFRAVLDRFEVVVDDSFGGDIMRRVGAEFGLKLRAIHTRGNPRRLEDLSAWLRDPTSFLIAVDGGTVYGHVPPGTIRLAARLNSTLRPLAVCARPRMRCPGLIAEIPLPGAALALAIGAPLRIDRQTPVGAAGAELERRLDAAGVAARALLEPSGGADRRKRRSA
jgi:lysophospholipid acyltransferase (LPLAT)-like uncharacterized protein